MNHAWSMLRWDEARPFLTHRFWTSQTYWIEAYKNAGLQNLMADAEIYRTELAKVKSDPFFDAITIRIWARAKDFTINSDSGRVVAGDADNPRSYSEYWTFIRSVDRTGASKADHSCPSCGAHLDINLQGHCEHCGVKVAGGNLDWSLSRIEQDEAYSG